MKGILLVCIFTLLGLACAATQSQTVMSNLTRQNSQEKAAPTPPSIIDMITPARKPTKLPTPIGISLPINEENYVSDELVENRMKKSTLDRQPQEITKFILASYDQSSENIYGTPLKKINILIEDRDLNHDGILERIIVARLFGDEEFPVLYIFKSEKQKWSGSAKIELGSPNNSPPYNGVKFLSTPQNSDFDLIKVFSKPLDAELRYVDYYQMQNGKYELVQQDETK